MHTKTALACVTLLVGALSAGSALAQNAPSATGALAGGNGSMTCGDFLQLSHGEQASLAGSIKMDSTPSSLTSNSGFGSANNNSGTADNSTNSGNPSSTSPGNQNGTLGPDTPLTSGQLVAACQAASPTTTLQDAYSSFGASDSGQK
jgi:hypothetical protein